MIHINPKFFQKQVDAFTPLMIKIDYSQADAIIINLISYLVNNNFAVLLFRKCYPIIRVWCPIKCRFLFAVTPTALLTFAPFLSLEFWPYFLSNDIYQDAMIHGIDNFSSSCGRSQVKAQFYSCARLLIDKLNKCIRDTFTVSPVGAKRCCLSCYRKT